MDNGGSPRPIIKWNNEERVEWYTILWKYLYSFPFGYKT